TSVLHFVSHLLYIMSMITHRYFYFFFFILYADHRDLHLSSHSFPTRRSSDLGVPDFFASSTESMIAVICGTPTPATMRVVQIDPGPIPTLMASAPASISALAPSAVAIFPATTCTLLDTRLMRFTASRTWREWPCAVSTTTRSTPASISPPVRSNPVSPTVVAAATRSL